MAIAAIRMFRQPNRKPPAVKSMHLKTPNSTPDRTVIKETPMKAISFKLLTLAIVFATAFLTPAQTTDDETTLKEIAGYRLWTRVNEQPVVVSATDATAVNGIGSTAI
jgi:hypothetical protein